MHFRHLLILFLFPSSLFAAENYTLFNPTPESKLRALNTERPSKSNYVTTVDPGHVQVESSFINVARDKNCSTDNCAKNSRKSVGNSTLLRLGLTEKSEISVLANDLYARNKTKFLNGSQNTKKGFGDVFMRFKYSFRGNNNGKYGLALIPFAKVSSAQDGVGNRNLKGGLMLPFSMNLNSRWTVGGMAQVDLLRSDLGLSSRRNYAAYTNTFYLLRNHSQRVQMFIEYYTYKAKIHDAKRVNTIDVGGSYLLTKRFKIDFGTNFGITKAASDLEYYTGFGYKF